MSAIRKLAPYFGPCLCKLLYNIINIIERVIATLRKKNELVFTTAMQCKDMDRLYNNTHANLTFTIQFLSDNFNTPGIAMF